MDTYSGKVIDEAMMYEILNEIGILMEEELELSRDNRDVESQMKMISLGYIRERVRTLYIEYGSPDEEFSPEVIDAWILLKIHKIFLQINLELNEGKYKEFSKLVNEYLSKIFIVITSSMNI